MGNKITYGLENVHIAFLDTASLTPPEWETPIAIPGAVRLTPAAVGQPVKFYADNKIYFSTTTNDGYTAELEMALVPDAVLAEMLGWLIDDNGMVVEIADGTPKKFALLGQMEGDDKNRRFVYYDCEASRPAKENKTKGESIEPATDVLSLTILPIDIVIDGKTQKVPKGTMELSATNATAYNSFFGSVYLPVVAAA